MAFKLGSSRGPILNKGQVESKMSFKQSDGSIPGTPVLRKDLGKGILGEANNDGSIFISNKVEPGSEQEQHVLMHEMVHQTDMRLGKLAYNDDYIKWNGEMYERKNGKIYYNNEWQDEGSKNFPWENMPWE
jgi:hypothetical protein|tara:strand:+ start:329 stop:721 length:393 start_codon:yes stop_codon:yes gene_type:complete